MKSKTVQLFFLVLGGLIISWREWTYSTTATADFLTKSLTNTQEVGSNQEATTVLIILLLGITLAIVVNGLCESVSSKLSSPNSV